MSRMYIRMIRRKEILHFVNFDYTLVSVTSANDKTAIFNQRIINYFRNTY